MGMSGGEVVEMEGIKLPKDLYYTERNLWVKPEPDGTVRIGFNDLAQQLIKKVVSVRFFPAGRKVRRGGIFGSVESAKWVERVRSPVAGTIVEVNEELRRNPGLVNEDPYGRGWFVRIKPDSPEELQQILSELPHGDAVEEYLKEQIKKFLKKEG